MRQVAQRPRDGEISIVDSPTPALRPGWVLVHTRYSLISAGTERSKIELGDKNLLQKARARPDLAKKVIDRARAEGVRSALSAANEKLDTLAPLGYSSAGVIARVGAGVEGLAPGDRVSCGGGGWANHAEVIAVPRNLVAKVPDEVGLDDAAYGTVGAIALHGVRQAESTVADRVGVIGLGLVGQLAVRLLAAAGCEAFGIDLDRRAVELAAKGGARTFPRDEPGLEAAVLAATGGIGLDAVLICAATSSPDPLKLAARLARDRGRLVVVGDVPIDVERALLYDKELDLRLSRSYGPGRYDREYEERGRDLPHGYVRWTQQRNIQAFVDLVAAGRLHPGELTTHRFGIEDAAEAYAALSGENGERPFGILLEYGEDPTPLPEAPATSKPRRAAEKPRIGLIGAGSFARATLVPALSSAGAVLGSVASERGLASADSAGRFGFERSAASAEEIIDDDSIDAVVVATRHSNHADLAAAALRAGKAVLVEKPLALSDDELADVADALAEGAPGPLMVGFNRRFAPLTERLRNELPAGTRRVIVARVNAGALPADHWLHDPVEGGGRLLGEGCHFVDLLADLAGSRAVIAHAAAIPQAERPIECSDELVATLRFANGSVGTLIYTGAGDTRLPKERIEVFGGGLAAVLDDFRRLEINRGGKQTVEKGKQDKGHAAEVARFVEAVAGRAEAPPVESYIGSTRATLALADSLRTGMPVDLL